MALYDVLAPYYDRIYSFKDYASEAQRIHALLRRELGRPGGRLLDVGCGTGRHLEFLRRWYDVAGVDQSPAMLREARRKLGPKVPLVTGEFAEFVAPGPFDAVVCLFSAFGYVDSRRDREAAAANFLAHLRPGGVALVEGWVLPDRWDGRREVRALTYEDPTTAISRISRSTRRGSVSRVDMDYLVAEAGRPIRHFRELHRQRLIPAEEHLRTFRAAGFRARVLRSGPYRDRGLYVLRRPGARTPVSQ